MNDTPSVAAAPFWRRCIAAVHAGSVAWAVGSAIVATLAIAPIFEPPLPILFGRTLFVAIVMLLAYAAAGQWRRVPAMPRWAAQGTALLLAAPRATLFVYALSTGGDFKELFARARRAGTLAGAGLRA